MSHYDTNLDKNEANYVPLSPLTFLERTKDIYPNYEALVYESRSYTWQEVYKRCVKFASALDKLGVKTGDTVSIMAFNTPEIFEAHYSIPMVSSGSRSYQRQPAMAATASSKQQFLGGSYG